MVEMWLDVTQERFQAGSASVQFSDRMWSDTVEEERRCSFLAGSYWYRLLLNVSVLVGALNFGLLVTSAWFQGCLSYQMLHLIIMR